MTVFQAFILGSIQGLTEFFPISSSGHLVLVPSLFGWDIQDLSFDVMLHLGTSLAVLVFFRIELWNMCVSLIKDLRNKKNHLKYNKFSLPSKLLLTIVVVSIPVAIISLLLENFIETSFRTPVSIAVMLISVAIIMYAADKKISRRSSKSKESLYNVKFTDALLVSLSQVVALFPGTSRSGISISAGLFRGLSRSQATRFSFLLSIPLIIGAGIFKTVDVFNDRLLSLDVLLIGFATSFIIGFMAIKFLLSIINKWGLSIFVIYRILLGITLLFFFK